MPALDQAAAGMLEEVIPHWAPYDLPSPKIKKQEIPPAFAGRTPYPLLSENVLRPRRHLCLPEVADYFYTVIPDGPSAAHALRVRAQIHAYVFPHYYYAGKPQ